MATINPVKTLVGSEDGSAILYIWGPFTEADTITPLSVPEFADKSVHIYGPTFNGGTVALQGSNNSSSYQTLLDPSNTAITATAEKLKAVLENTRLVKPTITSGTGMSVTVALMVRLGNPLRT